MFFAYVKAGCLNATMRGTLLRGVAVAVAVMSFDTLAATPLAPIDLYDASSGVLPDALPWAWSYGADTAGTVIQMNASPPVLVLDTRLSTGKAGYSQSIGAALDSDAGFAVDFRVRIGAESHASLHRSGFSVIVLDQRAQGVELSFWTGEVFAKNADRTANGTFTHGESIGIDTQTAARDYRLTFLGGQYSLASEGALLTGALRNYAPAADFPFNIVPYGMPNFVFFGDNTSSASALVELGRVSVSPIPEPAVGTLMLLGLGWLVCAKRRRGLRC